MSDGLGSGGLMRWRPMMAFAAMVAVSMILIAIRPDRMSFGGAVCAALALVIAALPAIQVLGRPNRGRLPILPLVGLFYVPFFVLPGFLSGFIYPGAGPMVIYGEGASVLGISVKATAILLVGVAILVMGMAVARRLPELSLPPLPTPTPRRLAWTARSLLALSFLFLAVPGLEQVPSLGQLVRPLGILAFCLAAAARFEGAIGTVEAMLVFGVLLPLRLASGLASGSLNNALLLLAILAVFAASRQRRLIVPMVLVVGLGAAIYAPMQVFRHFSWNPVVVSADLSTKAAWVVDRVKEMSFAELVHQPPGQRSVLQAMAWPLAKRLDQMTVLAVVVEHTGRDVDPWGGHTLVNLVTGLVPRAIWPAKPAERFGNEFGQRYGLLSPVETAMSVNLPWLIEFYANFRLMGVVVGMGLVGLVLGALDRTLNRPGSSGPQAALAATLLLPLVVAESNISLMASNLPLIGAVLWLGLFAAFRPAGR